VVSELLAVASADAPMSHGTCGTKYLMGFASRFNIKQNMACLNPFQFHKECSDLALQIPDRIYYFYIIHIYIYVYIYIINIMLFSRSGSTQTVV